LEVCCAKMLPASCRQQAGSLRSPEMRLRVLLF